MSVMLPTQAYVIIIQRTTIGHTGGTSENYDYTSRSETDINSELDGSLQKKIVHIFCKGNGTNPCPPSIIVKNDSDIGNVKIGVEVALTINRLMEEAEDRSFGGEDNGSLDGTFVGPNGEKVYYQIHWKTNRDGATSFNAIFKSL